MKKNTSLVNSNFLNIVPMVCALMVVAIHMHMVDGTAYTISSRIISFLTHGICTTAVPIFFLLSGYLFYRNVDTVADAFQKQKKRVKSVLMPFLAWSAFYYGMYAAVSILVPGFLQGNVELDIFSILKGIVFYEYAFPMWYMFQLCVFILLAPILTLTLKNTTVSIILLAAAVIAGIPGWELAIDLGGYERALFQPNFFAYYWLGCLLARHTDVQAWLLKAAKRIPLALLIVALLATSLLESLLFDRLIPCFNNRLAVPLVFAARTPPP